LDKSVIGYGSIFGLQAEAHLKGNEVSSSLDVDFQPPRLVFLSRAESDRSSVLFLYSTPSSDPPDTGLSLDGSLSPLG